MNAYSFSIKRPSIFTFLLWTIVLFSFFLRLFKVDHSPHDLYVDEVAIGYNAYSVLTTGKDEHGIFLPLFFKSFGEYKLPVYIYLTAFSEFIWGKNAFAVRMPSVILGTVTIVIFILLLRLLTYSNRFSLLGGLLLAISPWHLQFSRAGFEANAALFFLVTGILLFLLATQKGSRRLLFASISFFIFSLYSYYSALVVSSLLILFISWLYRYQLVEILRKRYSLFFCFCLFIFLLPFIIHILSSQGLVRAKSETFLTEIKPKVDDFFQHPIPITAGSFARNYLSYFSLDFLFFSGDQIGRHSVREMGMNYIWQLPFFIIGIIEAIRNRKKADNLFFIWLLVVPLAASFTRPNPHALRSLPLVIPVILFTTRGICSSWIRIKTQAIWLKVLACFIIFYFSFHYLHIYYVHYPKKASPDWSGGYKEAIEYIIQNSFKYEKVAITEEMGLGYIFLYFYGPITPEMIQALSAPQKKIDKYFFVKSPYIASGKTLYVSPYWEDGWPGKKLKTIYNQGGDTVFHLWES